MKNITNQHIKISIRNGEYCDFLHKIKPPSQLLYILLITSSKYGQATI